MRRGVLLLLVACGGHSDAPPSRSPVQAPPPVVDQASCLDALSDARARFDAPDVRLEKAPDLDGDGASDQVASAPGYCGSGGCSYLLYVRKGTCAKYVGELRGRAIEAGTTRHEGMLDLRVDEYGGSTQWTERRATFRATGVYEVETERDCEALPREPKKPTQKCGPWHAPP